MSLKDIDINGFNYDDLDMYIYNSSGKKIATIKTYKGKTTTKTIKNLKKGTYYIKISSNYQYSGNYNPRKVCHACLEGLYKATQRG